MGDDAAAAARRIVAEVLDRHAGEGGPPPPPTGGDGDEEPTVAVASPAGDEPVAGAETVEQPAPPGAATDAAGIARRIVEEVLASGSPDTGTVPPEEDAAGRVEASVRGVPPEGLGAEDEQTVRIEVPGAPEPATDAPDSAAEIVRRIVADVQGGQPSGEPSAGDAAHRDDEATANLGASEAAREDGTGGPPAADEGPMPDDGPVAAAPAARPLVGWAEPATADPQPAPSPVEASGSTRTLRWLLASLLGAVALAVLFPLAVAALRALVALD